MGIKRYNPTSAARRLTTVNDFSDITKKSPEKSLLAPRKRTNGRNNQGGVTVRFRGVIEKCTYCVQRINLGRQASKAAESPQAKKAAIDAITPACAQACPTTSIVFGNIKDKETKVSKAKAADRNYRLLTELNVKPRTSYLAKVRNPNPGLGA